MLGLGISKSAQSVKSGIVKLLSSLKRRAEYFENKKDSKSTIKEIKNYELLDKATILLTPTATSDARVHSVKTYTGDELVTNGDFGNGTTDWLEEGSSGITVGTYQGRENVARININDTSTSARISQPFTYVNGATYKIIVNVYLESGNFRVDCSNSFVSTDFVLTTNTGSWQTLTAYFTAISSGSNYIWLRSSIAVSEFYVENLSIIDVSSDFDFDRASSATRINSDGLVQDMQSITDPELVLNGDFDTDSDWTFSNVGGTHGWRIADGRAICDTNAATKNRNMTSSLSLDSSKDYKLTLDILQSTDNITVYVGGTALSTTLPTGENLGYEYYISSSDHSGGVLMFYAGSSDLQEIDNVSVKDITFSTDVDLARINYDSNGENGHILLEPTSTNLVTYSEDFTQTSFWNANTDILTPVKSTTIAAPDGSYNAWHITKDGTNSKVASSVVGATSTEYTKSIWARTISGTGTAYFGEGDASGSGVLTTVTTEWQRIEITVTEKNFYAVDFRGSSTLTEVLIWGAQMEQLSYATSYIPSLTGSTVTRATETLTGSGNSTLINTTQGTIYLESKLLNTTGTKLFSIGAGTNNADPAVLVGYAGSNMYFDFIDGSSLVSSPVDLRNQGAVSTDSYNKMAVSYTSTSVTVFLNGVKKVTKSGVDFTPTNSLKALYAGYGTGSKFEGEVKTVTVFNEALSDDELELLTGVTNYGSFSELASANGYTII